MLTLKVITEETDRVICGLEKKHFKGAQESIAKVIELNDKRRGAQNQLDKNLAEVNQTSKTIGMLMKEGKKEEAEALLEKITPLELEILSIERKKAMEHPPKLFDLTLLQVECNRKFAYTAENTLKIIQSLYEKKLTTLGYEGFADVKINGDKKVSLTLDADINHLELDTESTVSTTANASVYRMTASKPASEIGRASCRERV